jgi:hypothetical protein
VWAQGDMRMGYFGDLYNKGYYIKTNLFKIRGMIHNGQYSYLFNSATLINDSDRLITYIQKLGIVVENITRSQKKRLCYQQKYICYWCDKTIDRNEISFDHYIPLALGGPHVLYNLVLCHKACNLSKNVKDPVDYALLLGKNIDREIEKRTKILNQAKLDEEKYILYVSSAKKREGKLLIQVAYENILDVFVFFFPRYDQKTVSVFREIPEDDAYFLKERPESGYLSGLWAIPAIHYKYICNRLREEGALLQFLKIEYSSIPPTLSTPL